jgi:hypothetical protein
MPSAVTRERDLPYPTDAERRLDLVGPEAAARGKVHSRGDCSGMKRCRRRSSERAHLPGAASHCSSGHERKLRGPAVQPMAERRSSEEINPRRCRPGCSNRCGRVELLVWRGECWSGARERPRDAGLLRVDFCAARHCPATRRVARRRQDQPASGTSSATQSRNGILIRHDRNRCSLGWRHYPCRTSRRPRRIISVRRRTAGVRRCGCAGLVAHRTPSARGASSCSRHRDTERPVTA